MVVVEYVSTSIRTSLPVHNALKLSDVLGQMSANSSKIILPATKNNTIQILSSTPHGGFSETNINSTGNQKETNKPKKKLKNCIYII